VSTAHRFLEIGFENGGLVHTGRRRRDVGHVGSNGSQNKGSFSIGVEGIPKAHMRFPGCTWERMGGEANLEVWKEGIVRRGHLCGHWNSNIKKNQVQFYL
jgi:hypothetical protein